jgi:hypothetical protein
MRHFMRVRASDSMALREAASGFPDAQKYLKTLCYSRVPVNSTHAEYDASAADWIRARDVIAGEDAVKAAGQRYLPRLDCQTEEEYAAYRDRASFFNATSRTGEGFAGLIFRRLPFVKLPGDGAEGSAHPTGVGVALEQFCTYK